MQQSKDIVEQAILTPGELTESHLQRALGELMGKEIHALALRTELPEAEHG